MFENESNTKFSLKQMACDKFDYLTNLTVP